MFEASQTLFMYCTSPVHAGSGQAFGLIDNPIQRERHTEHPVIAGSGVKGALRHHLNHQWNKEQLSRIFGPESGNSDAFAGAISFSDAQLLAFPVRSVKNTFVYAVSPTTLARAKRLLVLCGHDVKWEVPEVNKGECLINVATLKTEGKVILEAYEFEAKIDKNSKGLSLIAESLSKQAIPAGDEHGFFREKLCDELVLLPDDEFNFFVKNSTVVEAHVCIDDDTGTAKDGALFYTENLPPESILVSAAMATKVRKKEGEDADTVLNQVVQELDQKLVQFGGDATTGRGQIVLNFVKKGA